MHDKLFAQFPAVRYVAIYRSGHLSMHSRSGTLGASDAETDKYEELLVNPTLLKLATQRGNIDCGGLEYLVLKYGNFFQLVLPMPWGHVSICLESTSNPIGLRDRIIPLIMEHESL